MEENLQINDISNETGNIGQNDSTDSLFQPSSSSSGNLDVTFIDRALTPLAEPEEPTVAQPKKPTTAAEYWDMVARGAPGLAGIARAAGGDSGSDDSDVSDETLSEMEEKSKRDVEEHNERVRAENAKRAKDKEAREKAARDKAERDKAERDKAERDAARENAHEGGSDAGEGSDDSTSSGGFSGGGTTTAGGGIEYENSADKAFGEAERATSAATAQAGKAQEAIDSWKGAKVETQQAEANVKTATEKLTKAQDVVKAANQEANKKQAEAVAAANTANETIKGFEDKIQDIVDSKMTAGQIALDAVTMGIYGAVTQDKLEGVAGNAPGAAGGVVSVVESVVSALSGEVTGAMQAAMEAAMHGGGGLSGVLESLGGALTNAGLSMPAADAIVNAVEGVANSMAMAGLNAGATAFGDVTTNMSKQDQADILQAGLDAVKTAMAEGATSAEAVEAANKAMLAKQAEITGIDDDEYNQAVLTNNLNNGNPNSGGYVNTMAAIATTAAVQEIANQKAKEAQVARTQANAVEINNPLDELEQQLKEAQQALTTTQQAEQQAKIAAYNELVKSEQLSAAAEEALNRYTEASSETTEANERVAGKIADANTGDMPVGEPEDSESVSDELTLDESWIRDIKTLPEALQETMIGSTIQEFLDILNNYNSLINKDMYLDWWNSFMQSLRSIWGTTNKDSFITKIGNTVKQIWKYVKGCKDIFKSRTEGHITEFVKKCLGLLMIGAVTVLTGGQNIPALTVVTITKLLWRSLKSDEVDVDLSRMLDTEDNEDSEDYDMFKEVADDAEIKWQLPSDLGENYVAGKRSNSYSDYNYGLEGEDEQRGQLYSDEDVKGFINRVYRKSPTIYRLKLN